MITKMGSNFRDHFIKRIDPHKVPNLLRKISEAKSGVGSYNEHFYTLWELMSKGYWTKMTALSRC